ncbi:hypothetical protein HN747_02310 [archaeon]|jgi:hypothetical protein|nr:hypothetical protein [archaeon]
MRLIKKLERESWRILFNFLIAILAITSVILFHKNTILTTSLLIIFSIVGLLFWRSKLTLAIFIFCGLAFGIAEIFVSSFSVWTYVYSGSLKVPTWLFILWGITGAFIQQTSREIRKLGVKE